MNFKGLNKFEKFYFKEVCNFVFEFFKYLDFNCNLSLYSYC